MSRIAIIAAMEREVRPLVRGWKIRTMDQGGRRYRLFEDGEAALLCGGIGAEAARCATEAIIRDVNPVLVISVGFAGALDSSLQVGDVLQPRMVINAADGTRTDMGSGEGLLVSSAAVAGREQKTRLGKAYGASAVDMEAAAVAQGAQARGVEFAVLKAISDASEFDMPAMDRFVTRDGRFHSVRFACHMAQRPWLWGSIMTLARNSSKASAALCGALANYLEDYFHPEPERDQTLCGQSLRRHSSISGLNPRDVKGTEEITCAGAHTCSGARPHTRVTGKQ